MIARTMLILATGLAVAALAPGAAAGKKKKGEDPGAARVEAAYRAVKDALDEVEDADRDCRKAVAKPLERLKDDLRDLQDDLDPDEVSKAARKLKGLAEDAEEDCPKPVRRALAEAAEALAGPQEAPPPAQSATCLDLTMLARLASLAGLEAGQLKEIEQKRDFFCRPGQPDAGGAFSWTSGQAALFASGEWRYPNGQVARYVSGELRYPTGEVARTAMGEWHYPNGAVARQVMGQWKTPSGRSVTPETMLAELCSQKPAQACQTWTGWLAGNSGVFLELAGVELGWSLEDQFAADSARRKAPKELHAVYLGRPLRIRNLNSDLCLTAKENDKPLRQHTCKGDPDQLWEAKPVEGGYYQLVVQKGARCADVAKRSRDEGADVVPHACKQGADTLNQQFQLSEAAKEEFEILARHSEKCLDVTGASAKGGAEIQQHSCHGRANQRWKLEY